MGDLTTGRGSSVSTKLETDLTRASDRQIFSELEPLFLAFGTDAERLGQKRTAVYIDACRGEPVWAIRKGIEALRNGRDDGKTTDFLPSTQRLARAIRKESEWAKDRADKTAERRRLAVEKAEFERDEAARKDPISEENRKRIAALLKKTTEAAL